MEREFIGRALGIAETKYYGWAVYREQGVYKAYIVDTDGTEMPDGELVSEDQLHLYMD